MSWLTSWGSRTGPSGSPTSSGIWPKPPDSRSSGYMHLRGVPTAVISKWLGHATASFTMATYVHSQDDALTAAGAMYGAAIRTRSEIL
jgi:integrase